MRDTGPELIDQHGGEAVRTLRERHGLSQGALADEMKTRGIPWHQQTVGRVESGRQELRLREVAALAGIFGVPLERFTWAPAEARAVAYLDMTADRLQGCYDDTARAVAAQRSAVRLAERAIEDTARHQEPRAVEARAILRDVIEEYGPVEAAVEAGHMLYEGRNDSEEGDGDGGDAESEPGLVDQQ